MGSWGLEDKKEDAPSYVTDAATGKTGQDEYEDGTVTAEVNGWVKTTVGTGNRQGRVNIETLVATKHIKAAVVPPVGDDEE